MLGELDEAEWRRSLEVNLTAHFALTRRVWPVLREQGIGGSLVYVASKNAFAPGAGFGAVLGREGRASSSSRGSRRSRAAPIGVRANVVNPDAIFGDSRLWSDEVRAERAAAHGVALDELEAFYASRSLLGREVTAADVAEAVAFLLSDRSRATTGCVITVDGGRRRPRSPLTAAATLGGCSCGAKRRHVRGGARSGRRSGRAGRARSRRGRRIPTPARW